MANAADSEKQSRNGKKPVPFASGVSINIDGSTISVKGAKGELTRTFRPEVEVRLEDGQAVVAPKDGTGKLGRQYQGLSRALLANMVEGVTNGYKRSLDFRGVGYRAEFKNGVLKMTVGLSHQPMLRIPENVKVTIEQLDDAGTKFPRVHLESVDKELVGGIAARIRSFRPPNPYGGKGVRYTGEKVKEKAGKAGKA